MPVLRQWELDVPERAISGLFNLQFPPFRQRPHCNHPRLDKDKDTNFYPRTSQANTYLYGTLQFPHVRRLPPRTPPTTLLDCFSIL